MSSTELSAAATATLQAYGKTAITMIHACRAGGSRLTTGIDKGCNRVLARTGSPLSEQLRLDLMAAQREVTRLVNKSINLLADGSSRAVEVVVDFANARVVRLSERGTSLEAVLAPLPLNSAFILAKPAVQAANEVAGFVAQRSEHMLSRLQTESRAAVGANTPSTPKAATARRKAVRRA